MSEEKSKSPCVLSELEQLSSKELSATVQSLIRGTDDLVTEIQELKPATRGMLDVYFEKLKICTSKWEDLKTVADRFQDISIELPLQQGKANLTNEIVQEYIVLLQAVLLELQDTSNRLLQFQDNVSKSAVELDPLQVESKLIPTDEVEQFIKNQRSVSHRRVFLAVGFVTGLSLLYFAAQNLPDGFKQYLGRKSQVAADKNEKGEVAFKGDVDNGPAVKPIVETVKKPDVNVPKSSSRPPVAAQPIPIEEGGYPRSSAAPVSKNERISVAAKVVINHDLWFKGGRPEGKAMISYFAEKIKDAEVFGFHDGQVGKSVLYPLVSGWMVKEFPGEEQKIEEFFESAPGKHQLDQYLESGCIDSDLSKKQAGKVYVLDRKKMADWLRTK